MIKLPQPVKLHPLHNKFLALSNSRSRWASSVAVTTTIVKPRGSTTPSPSAPPPNPVLPRMPQHPFQKLCPLPHSTSIFAAAGPKLYAIDSSSGNISWKLHEALATSKLDTQQRNGEEEPSAKRRKLETDGAVSSQEPTESRRSSDGSVNFKTERAKGERKKPKVETQAPPPSISHVLATRDSSHLVVVTAEDKAVSVYELSANGPALKSKRTMPKRLCAATLTPDEHCLIVGDKFGDVYELPLHPDPDWTPPEKKVVEKKVFEPSASELTVHTKGNLQALKQQKQQKMKAAEKEGLGFEHRVLLGHVSLLTDVQVAQVHEGGKKRTYVLTADRDEHVRVSRYPQSHVIEGYCLGIREFVSRLCVLPWNSKLVAVGTGEPSIRTYEWLSGRLLSVDRFESVGDQLTQTMAASEGREVSKSSVFGIWPVEMSNDAAQHNHSGRLLVALEGIPLLLSYAVDSDGKLSLQQTLQLSGNALDVGVLVGQETILVSADTAHTPGSTMTQHPPSDAETLPFVQAFTLDPSSGQWQPSNLLSNLTGSNQLLSDLPDVPVTAQTSRSGRGDKVSVYSPLGNFLYGLEHLRKKRDFTGPDAEDEDGEEEDGAVVPPAIEKPE